MIFPSLILLFSLSIFSAWAQHQLPYTVFKNPKTGLCSLKLLQWDTETEYTLYDVTGLELRDGNNMPMNHELCVASAKNPSLDSDTCYVIDDSVQKFSSGAITSQCQKEKAEIEIYRADEKGPSKLPLYEYPSHDEIIGDQILLFSAIGAHFKNFCKGCHNNKATYAGIVYQCFQCLLSSTFKPIKFVWAHGHANTASMGVWVKDSVKGEEKETFFTYESDNKLTESDHLKYVDDVFAGDNLKKLYKVFEKVKSGSTLYVGCSYIEKASTKSYTYACKITVDEEGNNSDWEIPFSVYKGASGQCMLKYNNNANVEWGIFEMSGQKGPYDHCLWSPKVTNMDNTVCYGTDESHLEAIECQCHELNAAIFKYQECVGDACKQNTRPTKVIFPENDREEEIGHFIPLVNEIEKLRKNYNCGCTVKNKAARLMYKCLMGVLSPSVTYVWSSKHAKEALESVVNMSTYKEHDKIFGEVTNITFHDRQIIQIIEKALSNDNGNERLYKMFENVENGSVITVGCTYYYRKYPQPNTFACKITVDDHKKNKD